MKTKYSGIFRLHVINNVCEFLEITLPQSLKVFLTFFNIECHLLVLMLTVKNVVQLCLLLIIIELGTCQTVVKAKSGYFAGSVQDGVVSFLGIRYGNHSYWTADRKY